nr:MAG TPA: hypothetical protein [Caudoviricetes sp.]
MLYCSILYFANAKHHFTTPLHHIAFVSYTSPYQYFAVHFYQLITITSTAKRASCNQVVSSAFNRYTMNFFAISGSSIFGIDVLVAIPADTIVRCKTRIFVLIAELFLCLDSFWNIVRHVRIPPLSTHCQILSSK